jgi:hypothetical protein
MKQISKSFAERFRRAQDLHKLLSGYEAYTPPREEESLEGFQAFITKLSKSDENVINKVQNYRNISRLRRDTFFNGPGSIKNMIYSLGAVVASQYGYKSSEAAIVESYIDAIRYTKVTKSAASTGTENIETEKSYTLGKQSYATITKSFHNIITLINGFENYKPGNEEYSLEKLNVTYTNLNLLNDTVIQKYSEMVNSRRERKSIYDELKDRVNRIKSYVRSKYGTNSTQYGDIRSMSI